MSRDSLESAPLWRQLQVTAQVLDAVRRGQSGTAALDAVAAELRPGVQSLAYFAWRHWGLAVALRKQLAPQKPPPLVDALLGVTLSLASQSEAALYDEHTLVNQAVEALKRQKVTARSAAFANACLRRFLRERAQLLTHVQADPQARWNHPDWWIQRLQRDYPEHWQSHLLANNRSAPMTLRVNARLGSPQDYLERLLASQHCAQLLPQGAIVLQQAVPVAHLPGFSRGEVSVQDAAAQLAAPLLLEGWEARTDLRILDACAAPGGKTCHLLEIGRSEVLALEIDPLRARRIHENLQRLQLEARVLVADAAEPESWWDGTAFDAILLDAPCSASGIVRRHPDIRWLRRESDIDQLARLQYQLLERLWAVLRPGGRLLYCTCSVFHAEGQDQIRAFLARNTDAQLQPSPGHLAPAMGLQPSSLPDNQQGEHDGFFYALLSKALV